jgi:hypothetical protein
MGDAFAGLVLSGNTQVGATFGPLSVQLHAFAAVASGIVPSIMRSIDPELSRRMRTFGTGGLVSVC